ncbi:hypothetical protein BPOR_1201g00010 [Botrytis porri]|uniref:Uncharacterized protein n=1 Tax=Botrytis porri TaxID=87229 RepID=A0A4Z1K5B8_9HELO|nr:hypothetical protein BPOR_1201g00010 [Botrytis porri]
MPGHILHQVPNGWSPTTRWLTITTIETRDLERNRASHGWAEIETLTALSKASASIPKSRDY